MLSFISNAVCVYSSPVDFVIDTKQDKNRRHFRLFGEKKKCMYIGFFLSQKFPERHCWFSSVFLIEIIVSFIIMYVLLGV
jgi:hypothetical protein